LDEIPLTDDGRAPWHAVRHHLGIRAFGINAFVAREAGDRVINEHTEEEGEEELYLVLSGHATFTIDGEEIDAPKGMLVLVPPATRRTAFGTEAGTTVLAIGATPGQPYVVSGWEVWAPVNPVYETGDYEGAAARAAELAEKYPGYPGLLYNLACCESLAGRGDDAIAHLGRAIEIQDRFRKFARGDSDFDPIRNDPAFAELVGTGD
jgi:mannose-6-phosphate isomerase-like protein (cupin superfamily)